jgi:hypothetical protein
VCRDEQKALCLKICVNIELWVHPDVLEVTAMSSVDVEILKISVWGLFGESCTELGEKYSKPS